MVSSKSMKNKSKTNTIIVRSKGNPISIQYTTPVLFFFRILNFSFSFRWWCFRLVLLLSHWFKRLFLFPPLRILCAFHSRSSLQSLRFAPHSFSFHSLSDQFVVFFPLFFCCLFGFFFFHFSLWIFLCVWISLRLLFPVRVCMRWWLSGPYVDFFPLNVQSGFDFLFSIPDEAIGGVCWKRFYF